MDISVKNIFVSSMNRDTLLYPNGNSYTLFLTDSIKNIKSVELLYGSVPNTLLNVTNGTNLISFSNLYGRNTTVLSNLSTFSIPLGFYGASGIANEITNAVSNVTGITITYLTNEGKFLFTRASTGNTFTMNVNTQELATLLGFSGPGLVNSTNVQVQGSLTVPLYSDNTTYIGQEFIKSTKVASLNPAEGVFLDIPELRTICNDDAQQISTTSGTTSGQSVSRSFGIIPMDVSSGSIKRFKKSSDFDSEVVFPYPIQKLDRITVNWVNINGQLINFNGLDDNSFLLRFHVIPSK